MNRSLLIGIIATVALFSGIAIYFYLNNIKVKNRAATEAVPNDAFIIFQAKDIQSSFTSLIASSFWTNLKSNAYVSGLNKQMENLSSMIDENDDLKDLLADNVTAISFHNNAGNLAMLYVAETGRNMEAADIASFIARKINGKMIRRSFEKIPVFDITDAAGNPVLTISFRDELLLCSPEGNLVEDGLRKLKYRLPNTTKGFEQVEMLAETGADLNVFINYQKLPSMFGLFTKDEFQGLFGCLKSFANWTMLDVDLNESQFKISGVTYTDDSLFQFLDLFKNQTPKQLQLQQLMPQNTSFALQMGFSDYLKFNSELSEYLQIHKKSEQYAAFTDSIENRYNIDISQGVLSYIDGEASLVMTEPAGSNYSSNLAAFIRFKDPASMGSALKKWVAEMNRKGETDSVNFSHNGFEIERIKLGDFLKLYYGEIMEGIYAPYFTQLNDVFVFANDLNNLKYIIDQYKSGNTLAADEKYKEYESTLAKTNNVSVFISPSRNFLLPTVFVTDSFFSTLNTYQADFKKFEFFNIQFANTNNKAFYTHVQYKYSSIKTTETQMLWASRLDTTFDVPPQVVYNSQLKQNVIFVQDVNNTLYCLSPSGSLIWRSKLNGKLLGKFHTLDVQKNGSLCYLFSTDRQANLIDEKGVSLYNFPVHYPGKAIYPPLLTDFYGDSNYRFFVPLENNRIAGYSINGKSLQGWMPKNIEQKVNSPVNYYLKGSSVFVYSTDITGSLQVFDLKGKSLKPETDTRALLFMHIPDADTTTTVFHAFDSSGKVSRVVFDSAFKQKTVTDAANIQPFKRMTLQADLITGQMNYLAETDQSWTLYNSTLQKVSGEEYTDTVSQVVYFTTDATGKVMLANYKKQQNQYFWYDMKGGLYNDFPVTGFTPFNTANLMNDRVNYLIGGDNQNNIFVFRLR